MDDERLIECVRARELIYNKSLIGYRISDRKEAAWKEVAAELGATVNECTKRWQSLRKRFSRELRKQDAPSGSAAAVNECWPLFTNMSFLKQFVKSRPVRSTSNILSTNKSSPSTPPLMASPSFMECFDLTQEMDCSQPTLAPTAMPSPSPTPELVTTPSPTPKRSRKTSLVDNDGDGEFREVVQMYKEMYKERMEKTANDTVRGFGQMITSIIGEMTEKKQMKAIQSVTNIVMTIKYEPEE